MTEYPIKVRWQGDSRAKWETRTLEPMAADGMGKFNVDAARRANTRQKTQVVIRTDEEYGAVVETLEKHIDFCGPYGAHWGTPAKKKAAERVLKEIKEAKED